jgi:DNA polymerase I-like protein with 3'-5' exonuclease and polymerase domains
MRPNVAGIYYGQGSSSLAQSMGLSTVQEANKYIAKFKKAYPRLTRSALFN